MSRSRVFIFLLSRLYIYSFLLSKFPRKFLKRGRAKGEAKESILQHPRRSSTPLDCTRRGSENGISFLRRARGTFSSKESILRKAGRESNVSQSGWKKGKDGSVTRNASRTHALFHHEEANPKQLLPLSNAFSSSTLFSFHRVKNLGDFSTSSAHVAAPLKGEDSNFSALRKRALRRLLRAPFAELPRVPRPSREPSAACAHTMFLFLLCTHKCPTENVNLPSERFSACAIRARLAIDARLDKKKRERQREGLPLFFEARFSSSHSVNWNEF